MEQHVLEAHVSPFLIGYVELEVGLCSGSTTPWLCGLWKSFSLFKPCFFPLHDGYNNDNSTH